MSVQTMFPNVSIKSRLIKIDQYNVPINSNFLISKGFEASSTRRANKIVKSLKQSPAILSTKKKDNLSHGFINSADNLSSKKTNNNCMQTRENQFKIFYISNDSEARQILEIYIKLSFDDKGKYNHQLTFDHAYCRAIILTNKNFRENEIQFIPRKEIAGNTSAVELNSSEGFVSQGEYEIILKQLEKSKENFQLKSKEKGDENTRIENPFNESNEQREVIYFYSKVKSDGSPHNLSDFSFTESKKLENSDDVNKDRISSDDLATSQEFSRDFKDIPRETNYSKTQEKDHSKDRKEENKIDFSEFLKCQGNMNTKQMAQEKMYHYYQSDQEKDKDCGNNSNEEKEEIKEENSYEGDFNRNKKRDSGEIFRNSFEDRSVPGDDFYDH